MPTRTENRAESPENRGDRRPTADTAEPTADALGNLFNRQGRRLMKRSTVFRQRHIG